MAFERGYGVPKERNLNSEFASIPVFLPHYRPLSSIYALTSSLNQEGRRSHKTRLLLSGEFRHLVPWPIGFSCNKSLDQQILTIPAFLVHSNTRLVLTSVLWYSHVPCMIPLNFWDFTVNCHHLMCKQTPLSYLGLASPPSLSLFRRVPCLTAITSNLHTVSADSQSSNGEAVPKCARLASFASFVMKLQEVYNSEIWAHAILSTPVLRSSSYFSSKIANFVKWNFYVLGSLYFAHQAVRIFVGLRHLLQQSAWHSRQRFIAALLRKVSALAFPRELDE